jgi:hypothetical protein
MNRTRHSRFLERTIQQDKPGNLRPVENPPVKNILLLSTAPAMSVRPRLDTSTRRDFGKHLATYRD